MNLSLQNRRALVGGSTQGIGRAVAEALAESGCAVTLLARNEDRLREVAAVLPTPAGQAHDYLVADFDDPSHVPLSHGSSGDRGGTARTTDFGAKLWVGQPHVSMGFVEPVLICGFDQSGARRGLKLRMIYLI